MNARAARTFALLLLASVLLRDQTSAEQLQRLHVTSLTLATDVSRPDVGQSFHLIVALHVREPSVRSQTVQLPTFSGLDELGDERSSVSGPAGTDYRETLTLVAHAAGTFKVSPASFDAIDAADGKPKRFISNPLTIVVGTSLVRSATSPAARVLLAFATLCTLSLLAWLYLARRRGQPMALPAPVEVPETASTQMADTELRRAVGALRDRRDRPSALLVRAALWRDAGATPGETFADVLRRPEARDPQTRSVLARAERAAFVQDEHLPEAIAQLLAETEAIP